ncbi:hypothetical protein STEG23_032574, partial [Scotinomys teguina]
MDDWTLQRNLDGYPGHVDVNADTGYVKTTNPDMALSSILGPDVTWFCLIMPIQLYAFLLSLFRKRKDFYNTRKLPLNSLDFYCSMQLADLVVVVCITQHMSRGQRKLGE